MTTTVAAVRHHLKTDPAVVDILLRGILNLRRCSRWLIQHYGWETSEEAVVSALRRYAETSPGTSIADGFQDLTDTRIDITGGFSLITIPRTPEIRHVALETWMEADPMGPLGVIPGRTTARVLVDGRAVSSLTQAIGPHIIKSIESPLTAIRLHTPKPELRAALKTRVLMGLSHRGLPLTETATCGTEQLFFFPGENTLEAHEVVCNIIGEPKRPGVEG